MKQTTEMKINTQRIRKLLSPESIKMWARQKAKVSIVFSLADAALHCQDALPRHLSLTDSRKYFHLIPTERTVPHGLFTPLLIGLVSAASVLCLVLVTLFYKYLQVFTGGPDTKKHLSWIVIVFFFFASVRSRNRNTKYSGRLSKESTGTATSTLTPRSSPTIISGSFPETTCDLVSRPFFAHWCHISVALLCGACLGAWRACVTSDDPLGLKAKHFDRKGGVRTPDDILLQTTCGENYKAGRSLRITRDSIWGAGPLQVMCGWKW